MRRLGAHLLALLGLAGLGSSAALADTKEEPGCGMLPPQILQDNIYAGYGICPLKEAKEQALWKGLKNDRLVQQSRFTFTDGHYRWLWTIRIDERTNGKGRVEVTRIAREGKSWRRMEVKRHWHRNISREKMSKFNNLAEESGLWRFENGTWDRSEDGEDELYLHCTTLAMERVNAEGFRYSNVNISCNRPRKLKAVLEHVLDLSELDWDKVYNYRPVKSP